MTIQKKAALKLNADKNNSNEGTSGFNKDYLAKIKNEVKTKDPSWIASQKRKGKIPSKKAK